MSSLLKSSMNGLPASSSKQLWKEPLGRLERRPPDEAPRPDPEVDLRLPDGASSPGAEKRRLLAEAERCKGGWYARRVPAPRAHLLLDDHKLAQVGRRVRSDGPRPQRRGPKPDASVRQIQQLQSATTPVYATSSSALN